MSRVLKVLIIYLTSKYHTRICMFVCTLHSSMYYAQHVFIISLLAITINGQYVWPSNYTCVSSIISLVNMIYLIMEIMELLLNTGTN